MKKIFKYMLMLLLLVPTTIFADSIRTDTHTCETSDDSRRYTITVGQSVTITCKKELNQSGACDHSAFSDANDTGVCRNSQNFFAPFEANGYAELEVTSSIIGRDLLGNANNWSYTLKGLNVGRNQFWCDKGNACYEIDVTDENGNTYRDLHPEEYTDYSGPLYDKRSGYGCYLMCENTSCTQKYLFYTNRDMSGIVGEDGTTSHIDVFASGSDGRNVQTIYNESRTPGMPINTFIDATGFADYQHGSPMSPMQCAAAGSVYSVTGSSEVYELVIEEQTKERYNGNPGVYEVIPDVLLMFGNDFTVITPPDDIANSDDPYNVEADALAIRHGAEGDLDPSPNALSANICQNGNETIHTEQDFVNCYNCTSSARHLQRIGSPCNGGYYTIGILPEPNNATIENDDGTDPNNLPDGHITGLPDAEAGAYTWTCEDVKHVTYIYTALRIIAPFLLILFGSIDFFKAVIAGDVKKQQEARSKFPKRIIAFLLLLILPFIVHLFFTMFGTHRSNVLTAFCCIATNGNDVCYTNNGNSSSNSTPTNTSQIDEVTSENLCNGSNYLSPTYIETTTAISTCVNDRYGECISISTSDSTCKCRYTALEIPQELCTRDNCAVGYKGGRCFYNVRKGVSISTINNITTNLTQIKKVHQSGTTGDYYDGYFDYDMHINESIPSSVCTGELNGTPYNCNSNETSCNCIYGNSIY